MSLDPSTPSKDDSKREDKRNFHLMEILTTERKYVQRLEHTKIDYINVIAQKSLLTIGWWDFVLKTRSIVFILILSFTLLPQTNKMYYLRT